ncbi:MAG: hypothetical protein ACH34Y_05855 [Brachymonas sp.]|jgi:hypothetical protein
MLKTRSILFYGAALLSLAACGGGGAPATSTGGGGAGGGGGGAAGSLTISGASPSSLNGTCSASSPTSTTTGNFVNRKLTLSCGASSALSFIVDTSSNTLVDGDTTITLTPSGSGVLALCTGPGTTCPQVVLDASAKKLTFNHQNYAGGGGASTISFTVNGSINY